MQCLYSPNGLYRLCLESSGNLITYDMTSVSAGGTSFWSTETSDIVNCTMQTDGNFACYDQYNSIVWSTGTSGKGVGPSYYLALQNDRNIVVYDSSNDRLWASNTWVQILTGNLRVASLSDKCATIYNRYYSDNPLLEGDCVENYFLQMFSFVPAINTGFHKILSTNNLCVDITDGATNNGALVQVSICMNRASQLWQINDLGNNLYHFQPSHALQQNTCLDWSQNYQIQISNCSTDSNQAWSIAIPLLSGNLIFLFFYIT